MELSVLDLVPVRDGQTTAQAVAASTELARVADGLGFTRYWVAEHHNTRSVAATVPAVLIAHLAAHTDRIRVGSGGVMLPNHSPLAVAEQFALLEALHPGRIDLGIGRAPGTDPVTAYLIRGSSPREAVESFPEDVNLISQFLELGDSADDELRLSIAGRRFRARATPSAVSVPEIWLLGSSEYSADLAARMGLPYAFANHFGMPGVAGALARYRSGYVASDRYPQPRTLLPVNVIVHADAAQAERLARPFLLAMARLRLGGRTDGQMSVEQAERHEWSPAEREAAAAHRANWLVGQPQAVAGELRERARHLGVDEVMVNAVAGYTEGDDPSTPGARAETLRLLAQELL